MMTLTSEADAVLHERYLWMGRRTAGRPEEVEQLLSQLAEQGFLALGVGVDEAAHGDAQFLQTRPRGSERLPAQRYWQLHGELHEHLRALHLPHLPLGLGPDPAAPFALVWLVQAPYTGQLRAPAGFEQPLHLDASQREAWLYWAAHKLGPPNSRPAQRLLLQPPGAGRPACWHYGTYGGDLPVPGDSVGERLRTLLAALPRYARNATGLALPPALAEAATWPFLVNQRVGGSFEGMSRVQGHCELFLGSPGHRQARVS